MSNDLFAIVEKVSEEKFSTIERIFKKGEKVRDKDGNQLTVEETDGTHIWCKGKSLWYLKEWLE